MCAVISRDLVADHLEVGDPGPELAALRRVLDGQLDHHACEPPTAPAPSEVRPVLSVSTATLKPCPFPPMRLKAGTRQFSRMIWQVDDAQRPSFFSSAPRERPGSVPSWFVTTAKQTISLCEPFSTPRLGDPREDGEERREAAVRDPLLRPVQDVLVGRRVVDGRRLQRGGVGARLGLGQAERADDLPGREVGEPLLLLLVGPEEEERLDADRLVGADDDRRPRRRAAR